jgi:zinc and cadmium transporter
MLLTSIILTCLLGGVLSVVVAGFLLKSLPQHWLPRMVGFSAGLLLGAAMLSVLPEAFESGADAHTLFTVLLAGFVGFYALQRTALWRHNHSTPEEAGHSTQTHIHHTHAHYSGLGRETVLTVLVGDGFHNFVDGVLIAAAFLTDPALGWATAIAVIAHEIPQEAGDFVLLLASGVSFRRALALNALCGLASVLGGLVGYWGLSRAQAFLPYALVLAAASFIYIAIADLLPYLRRERAGAQIAWQTVALTAGLATAAWLSASHG